MNTQLIKFADRRLIKHSESLMITIPKIWIITNSQKKGDTLEIAWNKETNQLILKIPEAQI